MNDKSYIKRNKLFTMNLKERGITVGDLLIILMIILTTTILFKTFNKNKKTTHNYNVQEIISYKLPILSQKIFRQPVLI